MNPFLSPVGRKNQKQGLRGEYVELLDRKLRAKNICEFYSRYCWRSLNCESLGSNWSPGRKFSCLWGGEYSRPVYREVGPRPFPLCIAFNYDRKSTPITYLVWNFAYIFICCSDPMSFKLWINHKTRTVLFCFCFCLFVCFFFSLLFHSHKINLLAIQARFPYFFIYFSY